MPANQEASAPERSEDDIFAKLGLHLTLGGVDKAIRQLPKTQNDDWKASLAEVLGTRIGGLGTLDSVDNIATAFAGVDDAQIELLCAYDVDGRLGGADWIANHATPTEIWEAFKTVIVAAFPFLADARRAPGTVAWLLPQLVALAGKQPSTSGDAGSAS